MSRVSEGLYNKGIVKLTDSTGGTAGTTVDDATASVKDDIATLAARINLIIDALLAAGIITDTSADG